MYIVEGNIGTGKSTFLEVIKRERPDIEVIFEPKDLWNSTRYGKSLLENFYNNTKRWAYTIETFAMICRAQEHIREQNNPNHKRLVERSVFSGHYVFATNDFHQGFLNKLEWDIYNKWVNFVLRERCFPPQGFIYLRANPEVCFERIKKRNREAEKEIQFEYIQQVHNWHEKFLLEKDGIFEELKKVPVLVIDANEEFESSKKRTHEIMEQFNSFLT